MRVWIGLLLVFLWAGAAQAQKDRPKIVGQAEVIIDEDQSVTIQMTDLVVRDRDDWFYPFGFTMTVYDGDNYSINGATVTPAPNFNGRLKVRVTVNDGEHNSDPYDFKIDVRAVNDAPTITGQASISTKEDQSFTLNVNQFTIQDPDNANFTIIVNPGQNYSVSGTTVTPANGFEGTLIVSVQASDGTDKSQPFNAQVTVIPSNNPPRITGQKILAFNEDAPFSINLSDLIVSDNDNTYPNGFTLKIQPGSNYTFSQNTVTPAKDLDGKLSVNVIVNDGTSDSPPYVATVTLFPVNDAPQITNLENSILVYTPGSPAVSISETLEIEDPDSDSLLSAEVSIAPQSYALGYDQLRLDGNFGSIKSNFDQVKGVLSLTGVASRSQYTQALRSVKYSFFADAESFVDGKKIFIKVADESLESQAVQREIRTKALEVNLDIPRAFTPNGDHANDTWTIRPLKQSEELDNAVVRVYHRSGALIFESIGFEKSWDGRSNGELMPADSYFFTIDFGDAFRKSAIKGVVTLLR